MARHWLSNALGDGPIVAEGTAAADVAGTPVYRRPRRGRRERAPERRPSGPTDDARE